MTIAGEVSAWPDHNAAPSHAFQSLAPITPEYATRPIVDSFNWQECGARCAPGRWYLVVFRSVRRATADEIMLTEFDDQAHLESLAAGGLLFYFRGALTEQRECLSFCLWENQEQARQASALPLHRRAMSIVAEMYESYRLERYLVTKADASAALTIEQLS